MRLYSIIIVCYFLLSCNQGHTPDNTAGSDDKKIRVENPENGKWKADPDLIRSWRELYDIIDNFDQLNRKKFENKKAFETYGELLKAKLEPILQYSFPDNEGGKLLKAYISRIYDSACRLEHTDMQTSRTICKEIRSLADEVEQHFDMKYR